MKKALVGLGILIAILLYFFYPETVITYPAGITATDQPKQTNIIGTKEWKLDDFNFKALAEYQIKARVLSRNNFSVGKESEISPFDLALGWGPMSDQSVIDKIDISQSNRWYRWKADVLPIPDREISLNSANVHIIPKDDNVEERFDKVYKGSLVELKGYLVEVTTSEGWRWKSSLKRDDTAGGSCELLWVEDLIVLDK
ncbi:MAG: hypothetical protein A2W11_07860 [Ignavibacteria bacterium RBG_16_35_7]|nr:MAG: hypothetical protein A2W11_07860 [Ignavibacteria bacterium RBG_16_35_7]